MDKALILRETINALEEELRRQLAAQEMAADGATHSEARAETKWDTCGLEQSYLARGHARQFETLAGKMEELRTFIPPDFQAKSIGIGALVETEMAGERSLFFLLNFGGGIELNVSGRKITVITVKSPAGAALLGKKQGELFSVRSIEKGKIIAVE